MQLKNGESEVLIHIWVTILVFLAALVQRGYSRHSWDEDSFVTILVFLAALVQRKKGEKLLDEAYKLQSLFFWQL